MKILLLEPYLTGSHKAWAEGYQKQSRHDIEIMGLSGNFWKWRMHGGALTLARQFEESGNTPDLILATDMLDLTSFVALTRKRAGRLPTAIYFHENQLTYPWSPTDRDVVQKRDRHYGFINYASALAADAVYFNSEYHRQSFLAELRRFLMHFPDHRDLENIDRIRAKSAVLPLGLALSDFEAHRPSERAAAAPLILWNHRWEFDKNPAAFFDALSALAEEGLQFRVAVLGECFSQQPGAFEHAKDVLGERIVQWGYAESFADYAAWLWRADILPVTSNQDFFGASVVEAVYCGCRPLLPKRLAYPFIIPEQFHATTFYDGVDDLVDRLAVLLTDPREWPQSELQHSMRQYDWRAMAPRYDAELDALVQRVAAQSVPGA